MRVGVISIVIPVYNAEQYLRETLDAVQRQSYREYELLLINDGSTDKSGNICDEYAEKDPRIKVFHRENSGPSVTRNFGVEKAEGEYIAFVDADDVIDDNYLEVLHQNMNQYEADLVLCDYERFYEDDLERKVHYRNSIYSVAIAKSKAELANVFKNPSTNLFGVAIWGKLYKAEIIKKHGVRFPEDVSYEEDCCFNIQYYDYVDTTVFTSETVYHYRQMKESLSKVYRANTYGDLVNGFNKRKEFAKKIEMNELDMRKLDTIFMIATINNYKKIAMTDMSFSEKRQAYKDTLSHKEAKEVFANVNLSPNRLTRWITKLSRKENIFLLAVLLEAWDFKRRFR